MRSATFRAGRIAASMTAADVELAFSGIILNLSVSNERIFTIGFTIESISVKSRITNFTYTNPWAVVVRRTKMLYFIIDDRRCGASNRLIFYVKIHIT